MVRCCLGNSFLKDLEAQLYSILNGMVLISRASSDGHVKFSVHQPNTGNDVSAFNGPVKCEITLYTDTMM